MDFAQYLSVGFRLWCNKMISELIKEGTVSIKLDSYQIENPADRARAWALEYEEKQLLQSENKVLIFDNEIKTQIIAEQAPKVTYFDKILADSKSTLTITQIAKDYNLSGQALNTILNNNKVQYKTNGTWLLFATHVNKGYTKSKTYVLESTGDTKLSTQWTQKGRAFIHNLLEKEGISAIED